VSTGWLGAGVAPGPVEGDAEGEGAGVTSGADGDGASDGVGTAVGTWPKPPDGEQAPANATTMTTTKVRIRRE
jgi:hypothetical protein